MQIFELIPNNLIIIGVIIIFSVINIFPIMIFISPEIFIMGVVYLVVSSKISIITAFLIMVLGSIIGEIISYFLGYKSKDVLSEIKFLEKHQDRILVFEKNLEKNPTKYLIIGKLLPFTTWIVPVFAGYLKIDFKKFLIINSIMVSWGIFSISFVMYLGNNLIDKYIKDYKKEIIITLFLALVIFMIYKIISFNKQKNS